MTLRITMNPHTSSRWLAALAGTAALIAGGLSGCVSLDPEGDINRAATTVQGRSGFAPAWDQPWADHFEAWDGVSPLSAEQAVVTALKNNREIRGQVEEIAVGRADLVQARLLPNPVLSLTLRFPFDPVSGGSFVGAQAIQTFTALWLRPTKIKAADARLNATVLGVSDKALRLVADVKTLHAKIAYGQRSETITQESIAAAKVLVGKVEGQLQAGASTLLAVNRVRQQVNTLDEDLRRQQRELAKERRRLLELMGFASAAGDWTAALAAQEDEATHELAPSESMTEDVVISLATTQRLDVAATRALALSNAADLSTEERNRLKNLGLGVDFERDVDGKRAIGPVLDVPIPIFDTNQAQISKAGSLARVALANHEAVVQRAVREARVAYIGMTQASAAADDFRHDSFGGAADLTQRLRYNQENVGGAFNAGEVTLIDWLDLVRERQAALQTLNDLRLEKALARIELEYSVGGTLSPPAPPSPTTSPALVPGINASSSSPEAKP